MSASDRNPQPVPAAAARGASALWTARALWSLAMVAALLIPWLWHLLGLPSSLGQVLRLPALDWLHLSWLTSLTLMVLAARRLLPAAAEGRDLNPLLQDPGMIVHPPMLYMGYVGFSVAFAFAIAALLSGELDAMWARWVRPWTLAAWIFLTIVTNLVQTTVDSVAAEIIDINLGRVTTDEALQLRLVEHGEPRRADDASKSTEESCCLQRGLHHQTMSGNVRNVQ